MWRAAVWQSVTVNSKKTGKICVSAKRASRAARIFAILPPSHWPAPTLEPTTQLME
jgi:hypothetical protein